MCLVSLPRYVFFNFWSNPSSRRCSDKLLKVSGRAASDDKLCSPSLHTSRWSFNQKLLRRRRGEEREVYCLFIRFIVVRVVTRCLVLKLVCLSLTHRGALSGSRHFTLLTTWHDMIPAIRADSSDTLLARSVRGMPTASQSRLTFSDNREEILWSVSLGRDKGDEASNDLLIPLPRRIPWRLRLAFCSISGEIFLIFPPTGGKQYLLVQARIMASRGGFPGRES